MRTIRAIIVDPQAAGRFVIEDVEGPCPGPGEAVVRVACTSLNPGEVRVAEQADRGWRPGRDLAGTVIRPPDDGSGPAAGTRVCAMRGAEGSWAEEVSVASDALAVLPDGVSFAQAAALPTAGLTALFALTRGGPLLAKRVLITGSTGGIGQLLHQLATLSGATVVGSVRHAEQVDAVREAGADHVVVGDLASARDLGPFDVIIDSLGGQPLAAALTHLAPDGVCVNFGSSAGSQSPIDIGAFMRTGGAALYGMRLGAELHGRGGGRELADLVRLVAQKRLRPKIAVDASWDEVARVAQDLTQRRLIGKAVLTIPE